MKKLKILAIHASQRGKNSNLYFLLEKALGGLSDENVEKEIIVASELNLRPCEHHYSINAKMCVHPCLITQIDKKDEMKKIYDGILSADVVIFSTPIYWGNQSQLMQLMIERLNSLENSRSVYHQDLIKNKVGGIMILGHEDGYQHVAGSLMNFMTALGLILPPQCYAVWVGESDENTHLDRKRLETDTAIQQRYIDLVARLVEFAKQLNKISNYSKP